MESAEDAKKAQQCKVIKVNAGECIIVWKLKNRKNCKVTAQCGKEDVVSS